MAKSLKDWERRRIAPFTASNYSERRICALEVFMLTTQLRGQAALDEFNRQQEAQMRKPPPPLIEPDPEGLKLKAFFRPIAEEITKMRGYPDYWKHHSVRRSEW